MQFLTPAVFNKEKTERGVGGGRQREAGVGRYCIAARQDSIIYRCL